MKVQEKIKMQAHLTSGVVMDIAAFKVRHSFGMEIDTTALRAARASSSSIGAMDESSGKFKMQARHRTSSSVIVYIAAFKVSHSFDQDATALQAARERGQAP